jgi:hypothetical protein
VTEVDGPHGDGVIATWAAWVDRWWDRCAGRPSGPDDPTFPWRRHLFTILAVVGFAGLDAARRAFDGALTKIHPVDGPGYSANDLHGGQDEANAALDAWAQGAAEFARFLRWTGRHLAVVHTLVELALIPFSAVLLYGLIRFLRNEVAAAGNDIERPEPHFVVLRICSLAVVGYAGCGLLNQGLELVILARDHAGTATALLLRASFFVRRGSLLLILVPALATALLLARARWHPFARLRAAGSAYRVLGVLAGLHFLLLLVSVPAEQARDAIRLWPERGWLAVWGVLATAGFSLTLAVLGLRLSTLRRHGGTILGLRLTLALAIAGGAVVGVGIALHRGAGWGNGVTALGIVVGVVGLLSLPILTATGARLSGRPRDEPSPQAQVVVPAVLAAMPLIALEVAAVEAGAPELITTTRARWLVLVAVLVAALAAVAYVAARWYGEHAYRAARDQTHARGRFVAFTAIVAGLLAGSIAVAWWVIADPWEHGTSLGVLALVGSFLVLLTVVIGTVGYLVEGRAVPASLDYVGLRRIPLVSALIAWGLVGNALPDAAYHEVRVLADQPADAARSVTVGDAFERWLATNAPDAGDADPAPTEPRTVPGIPMVFVMTAGGGIRAATFTSYAIECLFSDLDPTACTGDDRFAAGASDSWSRVFMASGASGGSVGIASVATARRAAQAAGADEDRDWIARRLGTDLLSPELAWQLFVEVPNSTLAFNPHLERAEILERTWERRFGPEGTGPGARPYFAPADADSWTDPLMFLNGTNLPDGCRVTISRARTTAGGAGTGPAPQGATARDDCRRRRLDDPADTLDQAVARDLADFLCADEDLRMSTAAFLSARFPLVSPTGIVRNLAERRPECPGATATVELSIGDGGYRDNTGAAALADVWSELEALVVDHNRRHDTCVVPLLVEIDNGHRNRLARQPPEPSIQLTAPLQGALGVFASRDAGPIEAMAAEFSRALDPASVVTVNGDANGPRFARVSPYLHPGVLAPLGWSLSKAAVGDLQDQLDGVDENIRAVQTIGSWLAPGSLSCTIGGEAAGEATE